MLKTIIYACVLTTIGIILSAYASISATPQKGGSCWAALGTRMALDPLVEFTCEHLGKRSIYQIYENGYRVVAMTTSPQYSGFVSIIIEEQR